MACKPPNTTGYNLGPDINVSIFIPGRIEFLGKHTDYCGGRSIVCAIERGFDARITPNDGDELHIFNEDTRKGASIKLSREAPSDGPKWILYPQAVVRRTTDNFASRPLKGLKLSFRSSLPGASGLSSSSALVTMVFIALVQRNDLSETPEYVENIKDAYDLAGYLGCIENGRTFRGLRGVGGVGTFGGSQDHTAIVCGRRGFLSRFSYNPVHREADILLPSEYTFLVASSGVKAAKTGDAMQKYNRVSQMVSEIVSKWPGGHATLAEIIEREGIDEVERFARGTALPFPESEVIDRVRQFYSENYALMDQVSALLERGEVEKVGGLIDLSQRNAERYLKNQTDETVFLQRTARELGAAAASAFGAGFGGSVYALVKASDARRIREEWRRRYITEFPRYSKISSFFETSASEGSFS